MSDPDSYRCRYSADLTAQGWFYLMGPFGCIYHVMLDGDLGPMTQADIRHLEQEYGFPKSRTMAMLKIVKAHKVPVHSPTAGPLVASIPDAPVEPDPSPAQSKRRAVRRRKSS